MCVSVKINSSLAMSAGDGPLIVSNTVLSALWGVLTAQLISFTINSSSRVHLPRQGQRLLSRGSKKREGNEIRGYKSSQKKGWLFTDEDEEYDDYLAGEDDNPWKREFLPPQSKRSLQRNN